MVRRCQRASTRSFENFYRIATNTSSFLVHASGWTHGWRWSSRLAARTAWPRPVGGRGRTHIHALLAALVALLLLPRTVRGGCEEFVDEDNRATRAREQLASLRAGAPAGSERDGGSGAEPPAEVERARASAAAEAAGWAEHAAQATAGERGREAAGVPEVPGAL